MGQATVDLPDPLENPNSALLTSADDLLAQLAGDEIDRLLAEAELDKDDATPARAESAGLIDDKAAQPDPQDTSEIDELFAELEVAKNVKPAEGAASAPLKAGEALKPMAPVADDSAALDGQALASVLSPVGPTNDVNPSTAATVPQAVAVAAAPSLIDIDVSEALAARGDEETGTDERVGLSDLEVSPVSPEIANLVDTSDLPVYLKPLVWLNSPLDTFPDEVREMLGKIGIVTMVNAVAVLAYVMIFRRHH